MIFLALILLAQVTQKATLLFGMSNFTLDSEKEERARDLYQSYVSDYKSNLIFGQDEPEPSGKFREFYLLNVFKSKFFLFVFQAFLWSMRS